MPSENPAERKNKKKGEREREEMRRNQAGELQRSFGSFVNVRNLVGYGWVRMFGPRGLCIEADELIGMSYRLIRTPYLSLHEIISSVVG